MIAKVSLASVIALVQAVIGRIELAITAAIVIQVVGIPGNKIHKAIPGHQITKSDYGVQYRDNNNKTDQCRLLNECITIVNRRLNVLQNAFFKTFYQREKEDWK